MNYFHNIHIESKKNIWQPHQTPESEANGNNKK